MPLVNKTFSDIITFTRASTATYFDSAGVLQSAAIDAPRLDYDPATLAARGLLIEEQRTNLLTYSEQFDDAAWTKTNSSITANATTAPSGTATADKLIEALDTNLVHQVSQTGITVVSLATYTASVFVKADTRTKVRIGFLVGGISGVVADANLTAETIGAALAFGGGAAVGSSIQAINNGWYRVSVSGSGAAGVSGEIRIELLDASGNRQYNGDGTSGLFIWGAQLEAGAFPTSYIPTTTTALTRSADVAAVNTLSPWFNGTDGTIYAELQVPALGASGNPTLYSLNTDSSNRIFLFVPLSSSNYRAQISTLGATELLQNIVSAANITDVNKTAFAYATNNSVAYGRNTNADDTSCAIPVVNKLEFGSSVGFTKYIRRITYYPRRLSNAELQAITA